MSLDIEDMVIRDELPTYLSFDPGETTGFACFDAQGNLIRKGHIRGFDSLAGFLTEQAGNPNLKTVVYEDFKIFAKKARSMTNSRMPVIQAIGAIRSFAVQENVEYKIYGSDRKPIQQKLSGVVPPSDHSQSHWVDAYNHGYFYLLEIGLVKPSLAKD